MAARDDRKEASHFLLIKRSGFDTHGRLLSAFDSARLLLDSGLWPLWERTRCQHMVAPGHRVLVYLAGDESGSRHVVASAQIESIEPWRERAHKPIYPLMLDGVPRKLLRLGSVRYFTTPTDLFAIRERLSFMPSNLKKWGVAVMGGMRALSAQDYRELMG